MSEIEKDIVRHDAEHSNKETEALSREAEEMRLSYMKSVRKRGFMAMTTGLNAVLIGAGGFGWYLLVEANILKAVGAVTLGVYVVKSIRTNGSVS